MDEIPLINSEAPFSRAIAVNIYDLFILREKKKCHYCYYLFHLKTFFSLKPSKKVFITSRQSFRLP